MCGSGCCGRALGRGPWLRWRRQRSSALQPSRCGIAPRPTVVAPLALTAALTTILSPVQDHLRRVFHLADQSWRAAATSAVQFGVATVCLAVGYFAFDVPAAWLPFGSLAVANAASLTAGFALARPGAEAGGHPGIRSLWSQGVFLLLGAVAPPARAVRGRHRHGVSDRRSTSGVRRGRAGLRRSRSWCSPSA